MDNQEYVGSNGISIYTYDFSDDIIAYYLLVACCIFYGLGIILLLIKLYRNRDEFKNDYLFFRPKWILKAHLGLRRIFSILSNFIIIGIGLILLYESFFLFIVLGQLDSLYPDTFMMYQDYTGPLIILSIIFAHLILPILIRLILAPIKWVWSGFNPI